MSIYAGKVIYGQNQIKILHYSNHYSAMASKFPLTRVFSALAIASCMLIGNAAPMMAQGFDIFSGVTESNRLRYRLDFDGVPRRRDRYRLQIGRTKLPISVSQLTLAYPETFDGQLDTDRIVLEVEGNEVAIDEIRWDDVNLELSIYPEEPIAANSRVEVILSNVRNPRNPGFYYVNALVLPTGDIPLQRYVGTWVIGIGLN